MSTNEMERFWAQVASDPALKAALPEDAAADQLAAFARQRGFEVTVDEVREHQSASEELSEDALAAVTGGADMPPQDPIPPEEEIPEFPEEFPPEIPPGGEASGDPNAPVPPPEEDGTKPKYP